jgi:DNA polymerase-3 subunit alpha
VHVVGKLERGDRGNQLICTSVVPMELNEKTNKPRVHGGVHDPTHAVI